MLLLQTVLRLQQEKDTNKLRVNVKRSASERAFAAGQTEPQMWCLADQTRPELFYRFAEKCEGGGGEGGDCRY